MVEGVPCSWVEVEIDPVLCVGVPAGDIPWPQAANRRTTAKRMVILVCCCIIHLFTRSIREAPSSRKARPSGDRPDRLPADRGRPHFSVAAASESIHSPVQSMPFLAGAGSIFVRAAVAAWPVQPCWLNDIF